MISKNWISWIIKHKNIVGKFRLLKFFCWIFAQRTVRSLQIHDINLSKKIFDKQSFGILIELFSPTSFQLKILTWMKYNNVFTIHYSASNFLRQICPRLKEFCIYTHVIISSICFNLVNVINTCFQRGQRYASERGEGALLLYLIVSQKM